MKVDLSAQKAVLSIFNVYRIIMFKGPIADYASITDTFSGVSETLDVKELQVVLDTLKDRCRVPSEITDRIKPELIMSSGPNLRPSVLGSVLDA